MNDLTLLLMGMSGDLAKRKLIPALYKLVKHKKIKNFIIVGAARDDVTIDQIFARTEEFIDDLDRSILAHIKERSYYQRMDVTQSEEFEALHALIKRLEQHHNLSGNRLVYIAMASQFYCPITEHLAKVGIAEKRKAKQRPWHHR